MDLAQQVIGRSIRAIREQQGLTLEQLASRAGISYQYLSGVETGKENFTISVLESLAAALSVPLKLLILKAYSESDALSAPRIDPRLLRASVPLPEGLSLAHIEAAANLTQLIVHRINSNLMLELARPLHTFIQGNNFSGLVSNILCDSLHAVSPYKHNSSQRYPDLLNPNANGGKGEGLEVKATVKVGKGGESHNGHGGWHVVACYAIDGNGDILFIHIMFACLEGHQSSQPDWKYVGSRVNVDTGSQRTETYITNRSGTTKLRDGSVYLDPLKIIYKRWRQERYGNPVPPWSIFSPGPPEPES